ncbi:MAG TPA: SRPBCC domain-containing protein [Candidatus Dormibacteraeota bacterium]|nr:SRPBCC domain-containing protein [Candidatus Dormibacteraeota bacterium]
MTTLELSSTTFVARDPDWIFGELQDPRTLVNIVPGATLTRLTGPDSFEARIAIGFGPLHSHLNGRGRITASDPRRRTASLEVTGGAVTSLPPVRVRMAMAIAPRNEGAEIRMTFDVDMPTRASLAAHAVIDPIACDLVDRTTRRLKQQLEEAPVVPLPPAA